MAYLVNKKYQSEVSINNAPIDSSTSGSLIHISILGTPGETINIENNKIKFGNKEVEIPNDSNNAKHIIEFKVLIPDFKAVTPNSNEPEIVSITANIAKKAYAAIKGMPITIKQTFTIK